MGITYPCACPGCQRSAFRIVGNTIVVTVRHDGKPHVTTVSIAELLDRVNQPVVG